MGQNIFLFLILLTSSTAYSEESTNSSPIYVEVVGESSDASSQTSDTLSFDEAEIKNSSSSDLGEFLRKKGFSIKRQGGEGQTSALYLRGADADQVLVLIDGVPMNDASNPDRRFDFSKVPLSEIRRIEVLKGSQSVRYGSQALGGVIRIWTQSSQEKTAYSLGAKAGSFNSHEANASVLKALGKGFHAGVSGQFFETAGYSAALGGAERDAHRSQSGSSSLSFSNDLVKSQYSFRRANQLTDIDRGGGAVSDDPNYVTRFRQDTHSLTTTTYPTNETSYELLIAYSKVERHADNLPDVNSAETSFGDYRGEQRRVKLTEEMMFKNSQLSFGFEYTGEKAEGNSIFSNFPNSTAHKNDFFGAIDHTYNQWIFNLGLRSENHTEYGNEYSPEAGLSYSLNPAQKLKLRWAQATKWPSLFELYDPAFGNRDLKPEKSQSLELSWELQEQNFNYTATLFENRYRDLITADATTFRSINQSAAKTRGLELDTEYIVGEFTTGVRYQYLEPRQTDVNQELLRRARHEIFITERFTRQNFESSFWLKYNSRREDVDPVSFSRTYLPEFWVWGADVSYRWRDYKIWVSAENLSELTYQEVAGYRAPPRSFWLGLTADY